MRDASLSQAPARTSARCSVEAGWLDRAAERLWLHYQALDALSMRVGLAVLLDGCEAAAIAAEEGLADEEIVEILHRWHLHSRGADPADVAAVVARFVERYGELEALSDWLRTEETN